MENNNIIGKRINSALALRDRKQKELAKYLGIKPNVVSYFCNGSRVPNAEQIRKIAEFFNVTADYLLGLTDIASSDTDLIDVCKVTGLSEEAVYQLIKNKNLLPNPLSKLMEKNEFWNIIRVFLQARNNVNSYYPNGDEVVNCVIDSIMCPEIPHKYKEAFEFISTHGTHQLYKNDLSLLITELLDIYVKEVGNNGEHNTEKE